MWRLLMVKCHHHRKWKFNNDFAVSIFLLKFAIYNNDRQYMTGIHRYLPGDRMADLISENYFLIQVISRFGIKVGFGDKTVEQVCREFGVDISRSGQFHSPRTFLHRWLDRIEHTISAQLSQAVAHLFLGILLACHPS